MAVQLLGVTQVDWTSYIQTTQAVLGYSPTRGLDAGTLPKHSDPAAFLACVDFGNKPEYALREGPAQGWFAHYFVSFLAELNQETINAFSEHTRISVLSRQGRGSFLVVLSGTMDLWHSAIVNGCRRDVDSSFRHCMNDIYNKVLVMGFRPSFRQKKQDLRDGTFILV